LKIKQIITYFTDTIFRRDASEWRSPVVRWLVQQYKLLFYTARGLLEHGTIVRSAALTFYTLMSLVPILAVLGLVYLLYQHECFLCTIALSGALFAVWTMGSAANSMNWRAPVTAGLVVAAALLAVFAALTHKTQQSEGKLGKVRLFPVECDYRVIYGVLAVAFVCVLAAMVLPSFAYYLMWVLGIALFAELVLYTTKLM